MFRNANGVYQNATDISNLKAMVKDLEDKSIDLEKQASGLNVNIENL